MRKICLLMIMLLLSCASTMEYSRPYFIHESGYGPVMIGMTTKEASKAIGINLHYDKNPDDDEYYCHYVELDEPVAFMVQKDIITRIDVYAPSIATDTGITVDMAEEDVLRTYENVITEPHPYLDEAGKYLIVNTKKDHQIIFETDEGKITSFRTGRMPAVEYIEGCL